MPGAVGLESSSLAHRGAPVQAEEEEWHFSLPRPAGDACQRPEQWGTPLSLPLFLSTSLLELTFSCSSAVGAAGMSGSEACSQAQGPLW